MASKHSRNWEKNMDIRHSGFGADLMIARSIYQQISFPKPPSSCQTQPFGAEVMVFAFSDPGISKETSGGTKYLVKKSLTIITDAKYWKKEVGCF